MNKIDLLGDCVGVFCGGDDRVMDETRPQHHVKTCRSKEKL